MDGRSGTEGSDAGRGTAAADKMLPPARSLDYPCVTRLRHRRLLAFLFNNDYWDAYNEINKRTGLVFDVSDLEDLVNTGQLKEALHYVWRFAPPYESSAEAMTLMWFIDQLMVLDRFAQGVYRDKKMIRGWFTRILADHPSFSMLYPLCVAIAGYFVADRAEAAKNMVDWQLVRSKAASLAGKLAPLAPEIRCMLRLPLARAKSKNMFPLIASSSFRRRRYVKAARRAPPSDLARFYLQKKKSLPSPSHPRPSHVSRSRLLSLLEVSLYAGKRPQLSTEYLSKQGIHSILRTMLINSYKGNPVNIHPLHLQGQISPSEGVGIPAVLPKLIRSFIKGSASTNFNPFLNQGAYPATLASSSRRTTKSAVISSETDSDMKSLSLPGTHQDTVPRDESEKPRTGELGKLWGEGSSVPASRVV